MTDQVIVFKAIEWKKWQVHLLFQKLFIKLIRGYRSQGVITEFQFQIEMQYQEQKQSILSPQSYQHFIVQLKVITKIITSQLWMGKKYFPSVLVYNISKFVYSNPIRLKEPVFAHRIERTLKVNQRLLLKGKIREDRQVDRNSTDIAKSDRSPERSAFFTIIKQWKALDSNEYSYAEVISKGKLFINFLSNIRIKIQPQEDLDFDPLNDYNAYQKQLKDKNKYYTLICHNLNLIFGQFQAILQYEKDKKINDVVIKAFTNLMNKNIAIVRIEENYYTNMLGCEGKYLYIENTLRLPFIKNEDRRLSPEELENKTAGFPWLEVDLNNQWRLDFNRHQLSIYKEQSYPLSRQKKWLINKKIEYFLQQDVWISKS